MCIAVYIFVHNMDQMYIPNQSRLYRSDFKEILLENNEKGHSAQISLSKKRWKALDHEANRCEAQSQNPAHQLASRILLSTVLDAPPLSTRVPQGQGFHVTKYSCFHHETFM
jgi:hypothetical protein